MTSDVWIQVDVPERLPQAIGERRVGRSKQKHRRVIALVKSCLRTNQELRGYAFDLQKREGGAGWRLGERKETITLEWPLNIQSVLQTRAKLHLLKAPGVKDSEHFAHPNSSFTDQAPVPTVLFYFWTLWRI